MQIIIIIIIITSYYINIMQVIDIQLVKTTFKIISSILFDKQDQVHLETSSKSLHTMKRRQGDL